MLVDIINANHILLDTAQLTQFSLDRHAVGVGIFDYLLGDFNVFIKRLF